MNKIPVGQTVRFAYDFALGQLGTVIGLIWVPMLAIGVLAFLPYMLGDAMWVIDQNPAAAGPVALRQIIFMLLTTLLYACIYVSVSRQALGLRKGPATVHFSLGAAELRMWGALLSLGIILIVLVIIFRIVLWGIATAVAAAGSPSPALAAYGIAVIVGILALIYAIVRLSFLLPPVTVAEGRIGLERGWELGKGNFWRIFLVALAITLPLFVFYFAAFYAIMGREIVALAQIANGMAQTDINNRMQAIMQNHVPAVIGVTLIVAPFSIGLFLGASAGAYQALTGGKASNVVAAN